MSTLSAQVFSATGWNTLLLPARFVAGLVASVVYYEVLSREQVGLVFLLTSLATTLGLYADLGIERTLPRFLPEVQRQAGRTGVRRLVRRVLGLKLAILVAVLGALAVFARPLLAYLADRQRADGLQAEIASKGPWFLGAVGLLVVLGALFDVHMQFLTAYFRQRSWNLITLVNTLLQPALVTGAVLLGFGIAGVLAGLVLTPLCALVLVRAQVHRVQQELPDRGEGGEASLAPGLRERFLRYSGMTYLQQVTTWLYDLDAVVFLSAATLGLRETAVLGFSYKFARDVLNYVWTPLTGVMTPLLSQVKTRDDPEALQDAQASLSRMVWLLLIPSLGGLLLLSPRLLPILYPNYAEAVSLVALFLVFGFVESMLGVPHNVLMVSERYQPVLVSRLLAASSIPLVAWLAPAYGLYGVALAVGLARVLSRGYTVVAGRRLLGLRLPWRFGARVVLATAAMSLVVLMALGALSPSVPAGGSNRALAVIPVLALSFVGAAIFAVVLRATGGLEEDDRRRLERLGFPGKELVLRVLTR